MSNFIFINCHYLWWDIKWHYRWILIQLQLHQHTVSQYNPETKRMNSTFICSLFNSDNFCPDQFRTKNWNKNIWLVFTQSIWVNEINCSMFMNGIWINSMQGWGWYLCWTHTHQTNVFAMQIPKSSFYFFIYMLSCVFCFG